MTKQVLIIDDEPDICELLEISLARIKLNTVSAGSVAAAKQMLKKYTFDLCLTDMRLPDGSGLELISYIAQNYPQIPVVMITAYANMDTAIEALKLGAFDFLTKPVDLKHLTNLIQTVLRDEPAANSNKESTFLGQSPQINALKAQIKKLAKSQAPVYISGESGTGKELVARMIHSGGQRANFPFVPVNCGAIPSELMESEFFGHKKGSFTGAGSDKEGLFQSAQGGTLFLDEVADLPLSMQVKLLRVIQEKAVRPVGGTSEISIDVRILSATHKDLSQMVTNGDFRQDLYYRLNVIELNVPPLRDRREDISLLSFSILKRLAESLDLKEIKLETEALEKLENYTFPGNVRELENMLERACTLCEDNLIKLSDLRFANYAVANAGKNAPLKQEYAELDNISQINDLDAYLNDIERNIVLQALEATRWNRTAAASLLGINFRSMRHRLKKLGIE